MSADGITHFVEGVDMEYVTLERWEREYRNFVDMRALAVFKNFRKWKGFSVEGRREEVQDAPRRRSAGEEPASASSDVLDRHGGGSARVLRTVPRATVRDDPGSLRTLERFRTEAAERREAVIARLDAFASANIATVDAACQRALNDMEKGLSDFFGGRRAARRSTGTR